MDENISQARVNEAIALFHSRGSGEQFTDDVAHIIATLKGTFGIEISYNDALNFWEWVSDYFWCAGWITPITGDICKGFPRWITYLEGSYPEHMWEEPQSEG